MYTKECVTLVQQSKGACRKDAARRVLQCCCVTCEEILYYANIMSFLCIVFCSPPPAPPERVGVARGERVWEAGGKRLGEAGEERDGGSDGRAGGGSVGKTGWV